MKQQLADNLVTTTASVAAAIAIVCGWLGVDADPGEIGVVLLAVVGVARLVQPSLQRRVNDNGYAGTDD